MNQKLNLILIICIFLLLFGQGCATNLRKPSGPPQPAKIKFSTFQGFQMAPVTISQKFAKAEANQKASRKINEVLSDCMHLAFPTLNELEETDSDVSTLLIQPNIEEIKFIGGGARFMVGAMAGSSAVLMKVTYSIKETGEVIAEPEFYRQANAFGGAYSMGTTDNMMLNTIAQDICTYTGANR